MKLETKIYDKLKKVLPPVFDKIVLYANVGESSYDIHYYLLTGEGAAPKQCYTLAEEGMADANLLDEAFAAIAVFIREDSRFQPETMNLVTVVVTKDKLTLDYQIEDRLTNMAKLKKSWKAKYLQ